MPAPASLIPPNATPTAASYTVPSVDGMVGPAVPQTVVVVPKLVTAASPATFLARAMPAPASLIPPNATPAAALSTVPSLAGTAGPAVPQTVVVVPKLVTAASRATFLAAAMPAPISLKAPNATPTAA